MKPSILLVEDNAGTRFGFVRYLSSLGYEMSETEDLAHAEELFAARRFDAVILDINLPDGSGLDFIDTVRGELPSIPIIVITGAGDIPLAVEAMRRGADNFLTKPVDMQGLELFLEKSLEVGAIRKSDASRQRIEKREEIYFGESRGIREVAELAALAAEEESPVLITGETGTGKGVLAAWIHRHGRRACAPFVDFNCSLLKGDLLVRELFGNARGAFTSADRDREGLLDAADRGTLFLDEMTEMEVSTQAQFLKVLEEKSYRRLGDVKLRHSDFRLICATNRCIETEVAQERFRRDLYFRINVFTIRIPPLRERRDDLPGLARHILATLGAAVELPNEILAMLAAYSWPGNLRELRNVLERALILSRGGRLLPEHCSGILGSLGKPAPAPTTLDELEKSHIRCTLDRCGGDMAQAARSLGISKATLYRKVKDMVTPSE